MTVRRRIRARTGLLAALVLGWALAPACVGEADPKLSISDTSLPAPEFAHGQGWKASKFILRRSEGTTVWEIRARLDGGAKGINRVRYGTLPEGFIEFVSAKPLVPGECYEMSTNAGPGGTGESVRFQVADAHKVATGCAPIH